MEQNDILANDSLMSPEMMQSRNLVLSCIFNRIPTIPDQGFGGVKNEFIGVVGGNNGNNGTCSWLCAIILELGEYEIRNNPNFVFSHAVGSITDTVLTGAFCWYLLTAKQVTRVAQVPPHVQQMLLALSDDFTQRSNMARNNRSARLAVQQQQQPMYGGYQQPMYQQPQYGNQQPMMQPQQTQWSAGRVFSNSNTYVPNNTTTSYHDDSRFDSIASKTPATLVPPMQVNQVEEVIHNPQEEKKPALAHVNPEEWIPSTETPFMPAYNPRTHGLYLQKRADGSVQPIIVDERSMDEARHRTSSCFPQVPKAIESATEDAAAKSLERIAIANQSLSQESNNLSDIELSGSEEKLREFQPRYLKKSVIVTTSLDEAFHAALIGSINDETGHRHSIYRAYAKVFTPTIHTTSENEFIEELTRSRSFDEVRAKLMNRANEVSIELWSLVNNRFTNKINSIVKNSLGLPGWKIGSFVDDWHDLCDLLEERYGKTIIEYILTRQFSIIKGLIEVPDSGLLQEYTEDFFDGKQFSEEAKPHLMLTGNTYSLTLLTAPAQSLSVELHPAVGVVIEKALTPVLYHIAKELFTDTRSRSISVDRHLLRTADGVMIELFESFIPETDADTKYTVAVVS